jgi:hypothetical protein
MEKPTNRLLIYTEQSPQYLEASRQLHLPDLELFVAEDASQALKNCAECNIMMGDPHLVRELLAHTPRLRWVQSNYSGVAPLLDPTLRRDYILTNVGPLYSHGVSEFVFTYILGHERQALRRYQSQQKGIWDNHYSVSLHGKLIGILGVGHNGSRIAETAKFFGMRTRGLDRENADCPFIDDCYPPDQILDFVSGLDYLVCALPETPLTQNLVDREVLAALPPQAFLINVGRGSVLDDQALVETLQAGKISGAVLDVFREEPLPAGHPFWNAPNLAITFHTAAPGPGYNPDIVALFAYNYRRFISGLPLRYVVDWERGY